MGDGTLPCAMRQDAQLPTRSASVLPYGYPTGTHVPSQLLGACPVDPNLQQK